MRSRRSRWSAPRVEPFGTEAALCALLRAVASDVGWTFYPETGGWDAVLVLPDDTQVGIQAKLRANVDVIAQAIVPAPRVGPDVHAVLVPTCSRAFRDVAGELGIAVLVGSSLRASPYSDPRRYLSGVVEKAPRSTHLPGRCWLPPFVPDLPAGVPAPRVVSAWRVAAAQLCADLRTGLEPTRAELERRGLSPSSWCGRWLEPIDGTRPRRYRPFAGVALPDVAFPEVARGLGLPEPTRPAA